MTDVLATMHLRLPFPSRKAAETLRDQIVQYLLEHRPPEGTRFLTEAELAEKSELSRSTIRRAMELLREEGWLQSRAGSGTYIGPQVAKLTSGPAAGPSESAPETSLPTGPRLAIVVFEIQSFVGSWYWRDIIRGVDETAEQHHLSLELIGNPGGDIESLKRRLLRSQPSAIACLGSEPRHALLVQIADPLGIPSLVVGTRTWDTGGVNIREDNEQIMRLAVEHLTQQGHRQISLILLRQPLGWVIERLRAFDQATRAAGLAPQDCSVHWVDEESSLASRATQLDLMEKFIQRVQPTAVICGSFHTMEFVSRLHAQGRLKIPEQLSVVSIDQFDDPQQTLLGLSVAQISLPLIEIGRKLAELTAQASRKELLPREITLTSQLLPGTSVQKI